MVGGANLDQTAVAARLPGSGETVLATEYRETPGGKAANVASAAAAWGADVTFVGRVGDDGFGDTLLSAWAEAGVDTSHVRRDAAGTGLGIVFLDHQGRYQTIVVPRANARLSECDVEALPASLWAEVGALALALEAPIPATLGAARAAATRGRPVVLNAAPAEGMDPALWPLVTHLVVNEHEAALLAGAPVDDAASAVPAAEALLARLAPERAAAVIVTLGATGAVLGRPGRPARNVPAPRVSAVDTLGAGDTFVGVLVAEVAAGHDLDAAVDLACAAGAAAVTITGARAAVTPARARALRQDAEQNQAGATRPEGAFA